MAIWRQDAAHWQALSEATSRKPAIGTSLLERTPAEDKKVNRSGEASGGNRQRPWPMAPRAGPTKSHPLRAGPGLGTDGCLPDTAARPHPRDRARPGPPRLNVMIAPVLLLAPGPVRPCLPVSWARTSRACFVAAWSIAPAGGGQRREVGCESVCRIRMCVFKYVCVCVCARARASASVFCVHARSA